ncbi:SDR family oxidoreductase [Nocardia sp. R6R-6]|uniref:SDR family oxidoreductase n=1 Tax=Nocardia sp. R6R-6 TaxID=3459303 RepID=UPI00403DDD36
MDESPELAGRAALVTGGASGIGRAVAVMLHQRGAQVAVLDRTEASPDTGIVGISADVTSDSEVSRAVEQFVEVAGRVDILVNCAGIGAQGTVLDNSLDEWRRVFDVNLLGVARASRACIPHLRRSDAPAIVNITSVAATTGLRQRALYSASKGAVDALTRAMAADLLVDGIRVNAVAPGTVDTPWVQRLLESSDDPEGALTALRARQPHGRLITAEEVAAAVTYLVGPRSGSTTGETLTVDGGLSRLRI